MDLATILSAPAVGKGRCDRALHPRVQKSTVSVFAQMMAQAEGGEAAVGFASGMGAFSATLMAFLRPGDRVACVENVYPDNHCFMECNLRSFGVHSNYQQLAAFKDTRIC